MLIKFRGLGKKKEKRKEAPFIRVQGNPQENIIILTIVIFSEILSFGNLYQRVGGSHLALSDFQVYGNIPFGGRALVIIVDLDLKLLW